MHFLLYFLLFYAFLTKLYSTKAELCKPLQHRNNVRARKSDSFRWKVLSLQVVNNYEFKHKLHIIKSLQMKLLGTDGIPLCNPMAHHRVPRGTSMHPTDNQFNRPISLRPLFTTIYAYVPSSPEVCTLYLLTHWPCNW